MLILNDNQFFEGLLGGIGWLVSMFYIKNYLRQGLQGTNPAIVGIVTWALLWYIRKIGMNLYIKYKQGSKTPNKELNVDIETNLSNILYLTLLGFAIFYFLIIKKSSSLTTARVDQLPSQLTFPLVIILSILGFFIYSPK